MKDRILEEIERYKRRVNSLETLIDDATDSLTISRLVTKKNVYMEVVIDLQRIIKDEEDYTAGLEEV